jgi:hypothetical protein
VAAELTAISAAPAKPRGCKKKTSIARITVKRRSEYVGYDTQVGKCRNKMLL